jgi:hypothetical protein
MNHEAEGNTENAAELKLGEGEVVAQIDSNRTALGGKEEE